MVALANLPKIKFEVRLLRRPEILIMMTAMRADNHMTALSYRQWAEMLCVVAYTEDGRLVGVTAIMKVRTWRGPLQNSVELGPVYIFPEYRNQGLATEFLQEAETSLGPFVRIMILSHNPAMQAVVKKRADYLRQTSLPSDYIFHILWKFCDPFVIKELIRKRGIGLYVNAPDLVWVRYETDPL